MKKSFSIISIFFLFSIFLINITSAQLFPGFYYTPSDLLYSDWFIMLIIFLLFYFLIIGVLKRTNIPKSSLMIISAVVALMIAISLQRRVINFYGLEQEIGNLLVLLAALIVIGFFINKFWKGAGFIGVSIMLLLLWLVNYFYDFYYILPYGFSSSAMLEFYDFFSSLNMLGAILVLLVISIILKLSNDKKINLASY
ncbi:MAG: hypothetical protein AABW80_05215 [Nanoarchaeota archaeon]